MIEITPLVFVVAIISVGLILYLYRFPKLVIASALIGIAFLVCVVTVCIPGIMEALETQERQNPHTLHAYAMIVGSIGLFGIAYILWDRYRKKSGSQAAARLPLDSSKE